MDSLFDGLTLVDTHQDLARNITPLIKSKNLFDDLSAPQKTGRRLKWSSLTTNHRLLSLLFRSYTVHLRMLCRITLLNIPLNIGCEAVIQAALLGFGMAQTH